MIIMMQFSEVKVLEEIIINMVDLNVFIASGEHDL